MVSVTRVCVVSVIVSHGLRHTFDEALSLILAADTNFDQHIDIVEMAQYIKNQETPSMLARLAFKNLQSARGKASLDLDELQKIDREQTPRGDGGTLPIVTDASAQPERAAVAPSETHVRKTAVQTPALVHKEHQGAGHMVAGSPVQQNLEGAMPYEPLSPNIMMPKKGFEIRAAVPSKVLSQQPAGPELRADSRGSLGRLPQASGIASNPSQMFVDSDFGRQSGFSAFSEGGSAFPSATTSVHAWSLSVGFLLLCLGI
mmetsp:Transcript_46914/g.124672  ORF Transcript_46914/g.124672 Transcript_46914/m.124672 type:complete len:259 (-) Transcript_46914:19-795(-)